MRNAAVSNRAPAPLATGSQVQDPKKIFFPSDFKGKVVDVQYGRHHVLALTSSGKAGHCFRLSLRTAAITRELVISWLCWTHVGH